MVWIDALRLMAGLSMVGLHATADAAGQPWPNVEAADRVAPILLRAFLYIARTELFLIISVFLLMAALDSRPRPYRISIAEQARRLLIPFVFWTVFYAGFGLIKANAFGYLTAEYAKVTDLWNWPGFLLLGNVKYHMHFIPTLFGILLFFPLLRVAVRWPVLGLFVFLCLMAKRELDGIIYPALWGTDQLAWVARGVKLATYIGYGMVAAAAYGLYRRYPAATLRKWFPLVVILGIVLFTIKLAASYKTIQTGAYPFEFTPGFWADFLMPALLFLGCMCLSNANWSPVLTRLAPYSFGIYLCHPIFLDLAEIAMRDTQMAPVSQVLAKIVFIVPATALLVLALERSAFAWTVGLGPLPRLRQQLAAKPGGA